MGEKRAGECQRQPAGDVVHQFGIAEVFVGLAGGQNIQIVEGEDVVGAAADDGRAVFEDQFSAEVSGDDQEDVPRQSDDGIDRERFPGVFVEEHSPGHKDDEAPGGDVGHEFMPFDLLLRDTGAAGPDFGIDSADEGDQEEERAGGGEGFGGEMATGRAGQKAEGVENQAGEQKHQRELHEPGMKIA